MPSSLTLIQWLAGMVLYWKCGVMVMAGCQVAPPSRLNSVAGSATPGADAPLTSTSVRRTVEDSAAAGGARAGMAAPSPTTMMTATRRAALRTPPTSATRYFLPYLFAVERVAPRIPSSQLGSAITSAIWHMRRSSPASAQARPAPRYTHLCSRRRLARQAQWTGEEIAAFIDWKTAGAGAPGVDLCELRKQVAITVGPEAPGHVLDGWERATQTKASDVADWDAVAALNTPTELDGTATDRRDAFLRAALANLGT